MMSNIEINDNVIFRDNGFIVDGDIIYITDNEYVISCKQYPWMFDKEVIIKRNIDKFVWPFLVCTRKLKQQ